MKGKQKRMEDQRLSLIEQYSEYQTNDAIGITREILEKESREFLATVKPENRFLPLNVDFYENVLEKIAQKFDRSEDCLESIRIGFNSLEKYGVNLLRFPWRKEYHTVKLYTAYFKSNIEKQLRDKDCILRLLKSLGYTETGQQEVSIIEDSAKEKAIWTTFHLFLVQVDLQIMEEILYYFSDSNLTMLEIVRARSKTRHVKEAIDALQRLYKTTKRPKLDESQSGDDSFTNETQSSRVGSRRPAVRTQHVDLAAAGSDVSKIRPSELREPPGTISGRFHGNINDLELYGVGYEGGQHPYTAETLHRTEPQDGQQNHPVHTKGSHHCGAQQRASGESYDTFSQNRQPQPVFSSGALHRTVPETWPRAARGSMNETAHSLTFPEKGALSYSAGLHYNTGHQYGKGTANKTIHTRGDGSTFGDPRYANIGDFRPSAIQHFESNESDKSLSTKEIAFRHDDKKSNCASKEDQEEQPGFSRGHKKNMVSFSNGMSNEGNGRPSIHSKVTGLYTTLERQLTLYPNDSSAGKTSRQHINASTEHRRQHASKSMANATEATWDSTTKHAQAPRSIYHSNSSSAKQTGDLTRSVAADVKNLPTEKVEMKESSPSSFRTTATHKDWTQNARDTSKTNVHIEISNEGNPPSKTPEGDAVCDQCGVRCTHVCTHCSHKVCIKCKESHGTANVCGATKRCHSFEEMKGYKIQRENSADPKSFSNQHPTNVNERVEDENKDWPCSRCTFLNSPDRGICVICNATRGVGAVEDPKPGSRVCRNCTLNNEEGARICSACNEPLTKSETVV